ncbi:MAG: nucleotidyltransferase family protein [Alcanivoracaceae bacterium]|nr:nucleotidyltransferase family protein [Alcanivoracaceae bacterium]
MNAFLQKLINNDNKLKKFSADRQIIHQGLAPIMAQNSESITIQKANLLENVKLQNWQRRAKHLFSELCGENIRFLVFKGFSYTYLLYNQSNIRPYTDIDVLINQTDYDRVSDILIKLGYQHYPSRQGQFVSFQNSFFDGNSPQTVIDLHWQINNRIEFHQYFQFADLYKHALVIKTSAIQFKTLNLIDAFIVGCFHYQAHRVEDKKHIWLYDLAIIWNIMNSQQQTNCLNKAQTTNQSKIILTTLKQLNKTFINCLYLDEIVANQHKEATEDYLLKRHRKMTDIKIRLANIKGLRNKLKFLSEYIFQKTDYVQHRYQLKSKNWIYLYYPKMWLQDLLKLFK